MGRHVLPHQKIRHPFLPPDRREPLGGRTTSPTRRRHLGTTRSTPTDRTTRRPAGLRRPFRSVRPAPLRARQGTTPDHHHPTHRTRSHFPATLATDRLPTGPRTTLAGTPLRVGRRAGN